MSKSVSHSVSNKEKKNSHDFSNFQYLNCFDWSYYLENDRIYFVQVFFLIQFDMIISVQRLFKTINWCFSLELYHCFLLFFCSFFMLFFVFCKFNWLFHAFSFVSECKLALDSSLPRLNGPVSCHLLDSCTGIQCCIDVKEISKSVNMYVILDACNYRLSAGIEKLAFNQSLLNYKFGKKESFNLMDVVRVR